MIKKLGLFDSLGFPVFESELEEISFFAMLGLLVLLFI
jgi:hypothetical protein